METLGQFLKREREFRGISLERLAGMTRINSGVLKNIEADDFGKITQAIYVRSFLKSYAGQLGLDPSEILRRYEGQAALKAEKTPAVVPDGPYVNADGSIARGSFGLYWVVAALVAVSVAYVVFRLIRH